MRYVSRINQAFVREIDFQELEPKATFISTPRNHSGCMLNIISAFLQRPFLMMNHDDYSNLT